MNTIICGSALKYGDNINTDIISPPQYMELGIEESAKYVMSGVDPDFHKKCNDKTIIVAGANFGSGSSRETSPLSLKYLGVRCIVAKFFARIFYRNAINLGIVMIECEQVDEIIDEDELEIDFANGYIKNITNNGVYKCSKIPSHIMELIENGGLVETLKKKVDGRQEL